MTAPNADDKSNPNEKLKDQSSPASIEPIPQTPAATTVKPARKRAPVARKASPAKVESSTPKPAAAKKTSPRKATTEVKAAPQTVSEEARPAKEKKVKLVRDSFTMPDAEYDAIAALKKRCLTSGVAAKKSEILRAAIAVLAKLSDAKVVAAIQALPAIKTGRPAKGAK